MTNPKRPRALLLTVGTGDINRPEESLLTPLRKSIDQGEWSRVVLLPSLVTKHHAAKLKARCGEYPIDISPLPAPDVENDADRCFAHFDQAISDLRAAGFAPADIVVDYTRGTKAMSAALVLAAIRHDLPTLRYITGERDNRGMVKPGTERIFETSPAIATAQKQLDTALQFVRRGNFAGALALLGDDSMEKVIAEALPAIRSTLEFYAAWDRLDYASAANVNVAIEAPIPEWRPIWPTATMQDWVARLAASLPWDKAAAMAERLRLLVVDLLANGERRIRDRHFEDAVLRAYRVLELVGQLRLFSHGLDSARLPADHPAVQAVGAKLPKKGSAGFGQNKDGSLTAGRELVARLLKQLKDPLAKSLLDFDKQPDLPRISNRNVSVLIHAFVSVGPNDEASLRALYRGLEKLLIDDAGDLAREHLLVASILDFSARSISSPVVSATQSHIRTRPGEGDG